MLISNSKKPYAAISYDTATFKDLRYWLQTCHGIELNRFEPNEHMIDLPSCYQYINLIIKDFELRQKITAMLDRNGQDRFSFVHPSAVVDIALNPAGIVIGPGTVIYPNTCIHRDVMLHGAVTVGHFCEIGPGTYVSGGVTVGGSTRIGSFCTIGLSVTIYDNVSVASNVVIAPSTTVKKNILNPGTYALPQPVKKIK